MNADLRYKSPRAIDDAVIRFIDDTLTETRLPPTVREIGVKFGWSSPSTVHERLKRLVDEGRLVCVGPSRKFLPVDDR